MKFLKLFLFFVMFVAAKAVAQQQVEAVTTYINQFRNLAIEEMQRSGVPASIILAQGILETEAGRSDLVLRSNNHLGEK